MTEEITLRPYQEEMCEDLHNWLLDGYRTPYFISPTGSGKSAMMAAFLARLHAQPDNREGITNVVVAVPQTHITRSFDGEFTYRFSSLGRRGRKFSAAGMWEPDRLLVKDLRARLKDKNPLYFAAVTTHQSLAQAAKGKTGGVALPKNLKHLLVVLDEGHHVSTEKETNELSRIAHEVERRGGTVLRVTATPCRNDGRIVVDPEYPAQVKRTITDHALPDNGVYYMPPNIQFLHQPLQHYRAVTKHQIDGKDAPESYSKGSIKALVDQWKKDKCPKAVFIVPPKSDGAGAGSTAKSWSGDLCRSLSRVKIDQKKARVFDAVGQDKETKDGLQELLGREKRVESYWDSEVDAIVACQRFDEGTDWPLCSHVYVVGFPRNIPRAIQRWGRSARKKCEDHPFPDEATIHFFVPTLDPEQAEAGDFLKEQTDAAFMVACFLDDHHVGEQYLSNPAAIAARYKTSKKRSEVRRGLQELVLTDMERVQANSTLNQVLMDLDEGAAPGEIVKAVEELGLEEREEGAVKAVLLERAVRDNPGEADKIREAYAKASEKVRKRQARSGTPRPSGTSLVKEVLRDAWDEVLRAHKHLVLETDCARTLQVAASFTGQDIKAFTAMLREGARGQDWTLEQLKKWVELWRAKTGEWPTSSDTRDLYDIGYTHEEIEQAWAEVA